METLCALTLQHSRVPVPRRGPAPTSPQAPHGLQAAPQPRHRPGGGGSLGTALFLLPGAPPESKIQNRESGSAAVLAKPGSPSPAAATRASRIREGRSRAVTTHHACL